MRVCERKLVVICWDPAMLINKVRPTNKMANYACGQLISEQVQNREGTLFALKPHAIKTKSDAISFQNPAIASTTQKLIPNRCATCFHFSRPLLHPLMNCPIPEQLTYAPRPKCCLHASQDTSNEFPKCNCKASIHSPSHPFHQTHKHKNKTP